jgi:hypothetical protein
MNNINFIMYVAFILDPRNKLRALVLWLTKYNGSKWAEKIEGMVKALLKCLMDQYNKFHMRESYVDVNIKSSNDAYVNVVHNDSEDSEMQFKKMFTQHIVKENYLQCKSELDQYSHDVCETDTKEFDILAWWKSNASIYPILAEIARDILDIPISSVAFESAFSTDGCVLDSFISSLSPITVEALICVQD